MSDSPKTVSSESVEGLSFWIAVFFLIGEMAGSGILVLPRALADTGWGGIVPVIIIGLCALYAAICLSRCWTILEERFEEYRKVCRYPYSAIAQEAFGLKMRYFVAACTHITLVGTSIVYLLLSSEFIANVATKAGIVFCYWILIVAAFLCPLMLIGTPKDFWPVALTAYVVILVSCLVLIISISRDAVFANLSPKYSPPTFLSFYSAFGSIYFMYGGAAAFPTFQNDMKDKTQFPTAIATAFGILAALHLPIAILGYVVYGDQVEPNMINSLSPSIYKLILLFLFALRTMFAFLLVINSSCQEFEDILNVPNSFGWKRVILRTFMLLFIVFVALSLPRFLNILNLVGGTTLNLTSYIFPCLFYYKLCSQTDEKWPERIIPATEKLVLIFIICNGIVGGCVTTYTAFPGITKAGAFITPCYVNATAGSMHVNSSYQY